MLTLIPFQTHMLFFFLWTQKGNYEVDIFHLDYCEDILLSLKKDMHDSSFNFLFHNHNFSLYNVTVLHDCVFILHNVVKYFITVVLCYTIAIYLTMWLYFTHLFHILYCEIAHLYLTRLLYCTMTLYIALIFHNFCFKWHFIFLLLTLPQLPVWFFTLRWKQAYFKKRKNL